MEDGIWVGAAAMLGSALLHSVVGLLTKKAQDRLVFRVGLMAIGSVICAPILFLNPVPDWSVFRFLLMGTAIHYVFQMASIAAFNRGDMGLVYPVMRGSAPALAGFAAFLILGETLSLVQILGLAVASAAVIGFSWPEKGGAPKAAALGFALLAASMTALYSVNDASGARQAGSPLVYLAWFFPLSTLPVLATALFLRRGRFFSLFRQETGHAFGAAVFGLGSYAFALWAFTLAPVGPMAAMRETSIVFGSILAALVLKEPFGRRRIALAICLAFGLVLLQAFPDA